MKYQRPLHPLMLLVLFLLIALLFKTATAHAQTNITSIPNLLGISGNNLAHVVTDAQGAFADFNFKQASAGLVAFKAPDGYGGGVTLHTFSTNTPVQLGLGIFGVQEKNAAGVKGFAFYDASLSIGVGTMEKIPVLGWPVRLMIESGPAFKISGEGAGTVMEQSAAYADMDFKLGSNWTLTAGAGVIHCSDPHFVDKAMPMAHLNVNWSF